MVVELPPLLNEHAGFPQDCDHLLFGKSPLLHGLLARRREPFSQVTIGPKNLGRSAPSAMPPMRVIARPTTGRCLRRCKGVRGVTRGLLLAPTKKGRYRSTLRHRTESHHLLPYAVRRRSLRAGRLELGVRAVSAPRPGELQDLVRVIAERIGRSLERSGWITRDTENCYLAFVRRATRFPSPNGSVSVPRLLVS